MLRIADGELERTALCIIVSARWGKIRVTPRSWSKFTVGTGLASALADELAEPGELAVSTGDALNKTTPPPGRVPCSNRVFQSFVIEYECVILDGWNQASQGWRARA
jgi:hypothetical protein